MSQLTPGICHEPVHTWDLPVHTWDLSWASSYLGSVTSLVIIFLLCSLCECRTVDAINKLSSSSSAACVNSEWWMPQLSYHVPHLQFVWKRSDGCCQCQSGWRWWTYVAWLLPPPPRPWCVCNHSNRDTDTSHTDTSHIDTMTHHTLPPPPPRPWCVCNHSNRDTNTSHTDTSHIDTMTHHTLPPPPPRPWCVCNHSNRDTDTSHTDTSHIDTMTHHTLPPPPAWLGASATIPTDTLTHHTQTHWHMTHWQQTHWHITHRHMTHWQQTISHHTLTTDTMTHHTQTTDISHTNNRHTTQRQQTQTPDTLHTSSSSTPALVRLRPFQQTQWHITPHTVTHLDPSHTTLKTQTHYDPLHNTQYTDKWHITHPDPPHNTQYTDNKHTIHLIHRQATCCTVVGKNTSIWACDKRCSRLTRVCLYTPIYFCLTTVTRNCRCFYSVCIDE